MTLGKANGGDWLRLTEAADLLGVGHTTLRRWSDSGRLRCYRSPGGHRRYRRDDVEALLAFEAEAARGRANGARPAGCAADGDADDRVRTVRIHAAALTTLARVAAEGLACAAAAFAFADGQELEAVAAHARFGVSCRLERGRRCALDEAPAAALAIRERRRVVIADLAGTTLLSARHASVYQSLGHGAVLAMPVVVQGHAVGALELVDTGAPRSFTSADVAFAEFVARQAAALLTDVGAVAGPIARDAGEPTGIAGARAAGTARPPSPTDARHAEPAASSAHEPPSRGALEREPRTAGLATRLALHARELEDIVSVGLREVCGLRPDDALRTLLRRLSELTGAPVVDAYAVEGPSLRALASFDSGRFDGDWEGVVLPLARYPCSRRAVETGSVVTVARLDDEELDDEERYSLEKWGYQAQLSLPLVAEDRVIGLIELSDHMPRDFGPDLAVVHGLGAAATQALHHVTSLERVQGRTRLLEELVGIGSRAGAERDPTRAFDHVAERVHAVVGGARCSIYRLDRDGLRCLAGHDHSGADEASRGRLLDAHRYRTLAGEIAARRPFVLGSPDDPRLTAEERALYVESGVVSEIAVPLVAGGRVHGLIEVCDTRERDFDEYLGFLHTVADDVAGRLETQSVLDALEDRGRTLAALADVGAEAARARTVRDLALTVATRLREVLVMAHCSVYRTDDEGLSLVAGVDERGLVDARGSGSAVDASPAAALSACTGEVLAIERLDEDSRLTAEQRRRYAESGFVSELCLPLALDGVVVGIIDLLDRRTRDLTAAAALAAPFTRLVAGLHVALSGAGAREDPVRLGRPPASRQPEETELHERELRLLDEIAAAAGAGHDRDEIVAAGLERLHTLVAFDCADVALCDADGAFTCVCSLKGHGAPERPGPDTAAASDAPFGIPVDVLRRERVVGLDARSGRPTPAGGDDSGGVAAVVAALLAGEELLGALRAETSAPRGFGGDERRRLARVAAQLALALRSSQLYARVRRVHHSNLRALSGALNAKDYYTLGHAARVAAYMVLLGRELGWDREALRTIEEAAYLHDIGKIAVSDRVLLKAGGLNHREWDLMRQHPIFSAQILQPLFDAELVAAVRHHHERWDGRGYPDGLAAHGIPLLARAMCVVDSYDAMSLRRPYRQARAYEECLCELRQCAGTHFDPELVAAFLHVLDRLRTTKQRATAVARLAAARVDPVAHARLRVAGDEATPSYEAIVGALREVRDANPPTRFVTTLARRGRRAVVVVDAEDEASPQRSRIGDEVPFDDDLDAVFSGRALDSNTLYVDQFGVWVSAVEAVRDDSGATVAVAAVDLPIEGDGEMETLRSEVGEAFAAMLELGAGQSTRSEFEAVVDSLTGLYTHRYFHERLSEELERCRRLGTSLAVLLLDLDDFRVFNERHGHGTGDGALRAVAHVVETSVRHIDVAARYGGEEFAALLIDSDAEAAIEVAQRIRDGIAAVAFGAAGESLSVSIGIATYPGDATFKDELLDKADWAMHLAKRHGREGAVAFGTEHGSAGAGPVAAHVDPFYIAALSDLVAAGELHRRRERSVVARIALGVARELGLDPAGVRAVMSGSFGSDGPDADGPGGNATARTLVAVATAFAAMVAEGPYRPGVSESEALERLARCPALGQEGRLRDAFTEVLGRRRAP